MRIAEVSIRRPVFATVISLMLIIFGMVCLQRISVREYPDITRPVVSISTTYRGASAAVIENKITQVIEDRIAGIEGIEKITSSSVDERSNINVEFSVDRDVDSAANDIRDRISRVANQLPDEADVPEIAKSDSSADPVMMLNLNADNMSALELTDYAERFVIDQLSTVPGVARVAVGGGRKYAMRIWLDRTALAARNLTVADIESVLRRENVQLPAGRLESNTREFSLRTNVGLDKEQDFRALVIGRSPTNQLIRLGEVADVRLAAEDERSIMNTDGKPGVGIQIEAQSKANVLDVARGMYKAIDRVRPTLPKGMSLYNPRTRRTERVSRLVLMRAFEREEIDLAYSGDICAVVGVKDVITGDTLCDEDFDIRLEPPSFPEPVISMAVEPKTKSDQEKMGIALGRLAQEDPSFRVRTDEESGQTIISGMGELHLEILVDRMKREFNVEANVGKPQVAYRETIRKAVKSEGKFVRQSGGKGQFGHVWLEISPNEQGKGYEFENAIVGGVIPKEYIPAVDKGIQEAVANGIMAGFPIVDVKVRLIDGSYHEVDSSEMAFKIAGSMGFKEGFHKASPALLEPMMKVEIVTPEDYLGDVMGDVSRRRGILQGQDDSPSGKIINAMIPLGEMFGYATTLRSMSQGRATFTMEFDHYAEAPTNIAEAVIKKS